MIRGDGIGPEITAARLAILDALDAPFDWDEQQGGMTAFAALGTPLPEQTLDSIRITRLALKGPLTTPVGDGFRSANVELRKIFGLYANVRPARSYVPNGRFEDVDENGITIKRRMSELFADGRDTLFLYGFMYGPDMEQACPSCSSIIDALNGNARHISENIAIAIVARSPIERIAEFATRRGWNKLTFLSSAHNSYARDYHTESEEGGQLPMANVFQRGQEGIHHFWGTELLFAPAAGDPRHVDMMWPLWNVLDTTPAGRGEWRPGL